MAAAISTVGQGRQHHAHQGIDGDEPAVFQRHGGDCPIGIAACGHGLHIFHIHPQVAGEIHRGAEELHHARVGRIEAEQKALGEGGHQKVRQHRQEMQQEVKGRQSEDVAGDKGHECGAGKVEKALPHHRQDGDAKTNRVKGMGVQAHQNAQRAGDGIRNEHHGHTGEEVGEKDPPAPDGQRVHEAHAAGIIKVAPYRHGAQHRVAKRQGRYRPGHSCVIGSRHLQGIDPGMLAHQLQKKRQGEQGPHKGRKAPQRPEPAQVLAKEGAVKAQCP